MMIPAITGTARLSFIVNFFVIFIGTSSKKVMLKDIISIRGIGTEPFQSSRRKGICGKRENIAIQRKKQAKEPSSDFLPIFILPRLWPISAATASPRIKRLNDMNEICGALRKRMEQINAAPII
jgi:hypothetical protein